MRVKLEKRELGQYVELPGRCSKCVFKYLSVEFCVFRIKCGGIFGHFINCTSEDIFNL